jgi:hypothetical protein
MSADQAVAALRDAGEGGGPSSAPSSQSNSAMNLAAYVGERVVAVLRRLLDTEIEASGPCGELVKARTEVRRADAGLLLDIRGEHAGRTRSGPASGDAAHRRVSPGRPRSPSTLCRAASTRRFSAMCIRCAVTVSSTNSTLAIRPRTDTPLAPAADAMNSMRRSPAGYANQIPRFSALTAFCTSL